ncbi:MAG: hypothetical protein AWM53_00603 [Candidatus Dichloromethanomonas elyunquensis]|nr:MAG: hypothetical protein AWM53_00603 [Candidatus Dichloromethanomonas elyunquensis]
MEILKTVSELMSLSAVTAPKAKGKSFLDIKIITEPDILNSLSQEMIRYCEETGKKTFRRDGENVKNSQALVLISLKDSKPVGLNCGACGQPECSMLKSEEGPEFKGPLCAWRLIDLGIALGSAAKTAGLLNVDNRMMYSVGAAAKKIGLIEGDIAVGTLLSVSEKSIYFDRTPV